MLHYRNWLLPIFIVLAAGCSSSSEVIRYSGTPAAQEAETAAAAEAARLAEQERQRALAEQSAREAERLAREDAARQAEQDRRAEELARREAEAEAARLAAEERQRREQAERQRAAARELAEKQARVEELQARIALSDTAADSLDEANLALREAVSSAENLVQALADEQNKYSSTDPASGELGQPLDKASLEALQRELDQLKARADILMGQVAQ